MSPVIDWAPSDEYGEDERVAEAFELDHRFREDEPESIELPPCDCGSMGCDECFSENFGEPLEIKRQLREWRNDSGV